MSPKEQSEETATAVPIQGVWGTLDTIQQKAVLQVIVNLCQQILETWEQGGKDECASD